jgi:hypothetical protein
MCYFHFNIYFWNKDKFIEKAKEVDFFVYNDFIKQEKNQFFFFPLIVCSPKYSEYETSMAELKINGVKIPPTDMFNSFDADSYHAPHGADISSMLEPQIPKD